MKALVTGGAGFIGSHLCERLLADGWHVTAIDNLSTGCADNIEKIAGDRKFKFVEGNVCEPEVMTGLIKHCDVVFHLAAAVGVQLIVDEPVHTIETNYGKTGLLYLMMPLKKILIRQLFIIHTEMNV